MSLTIAPSTSFEATLGLGISGLVGTLALGTYDGDTATQALATTSINEIGTSGIYVATRTSPGTAGQYVLIWSKDGTLDPAQVITEDLTVTSSSAATSLPGGRDLCTLADVTQFVPGYVSDAETDAVLATLITSESRSAHDMAGREFVTIAGSVDRLFDLDYRSARSRIVGVGDMTTVTTVTVEDIQGATVDTVSSADYVELPRNREEWEPIVELWFPKGAADAAPMSSVGVLRVVGVWGFPSIPSDVVVAVAKLVLVRYVADAASAGSALSDAVNELGFDAGSAFASAMDVLHSYRPSVFA